MRTMDEHSLLSNAPVSPQGPYECYLNSIYRWDRSAYLQNHERRNRCGNVSYLVFSELNLISYRFQSSNRPSNSRDC